MRPLVFAVVAITAAPVLAQSQQPSSTPSQTAAPTVNDRVICERVEETGSRLASKRVCMTSQQWAEKRQRDREATERVQNGNIAH
jgi:invasion protein IalB